MKKENEKKKKMMMIMALFVPMSSRVNSRITRFGQILRP